jgi:hypothetical protein
LPGCCPHDCSVRTDLRHTYGSLLVAGGIDLASVKAAMGHLRIHADREVPPRQAGWRVGRPIHPGALGVAARSCGMSWQHIRDRRPELLDDLGPILGASRIRITAKRPYRRPRASLHTSRGREDPLDDRGRRRQLGSRRGRYRVHQAQESCSTGRGAKHRGPSHAGRVGDGGRYCRSPSNW